jgi:hypothetical protein
MYSHAEREPLSPAHAAERLRQLEDVRARARRVSLLPSFAFVLVGTVLLAHAVLVAVWPGERVVSIVWLAALALARPAIVWQRRRADVQRGVVPAARFRYVCAAVAVLAALTAIAAGVSPLLSAVAAATAGAAYLAGFRVIAAAVVVTGAIGDLILRHAISRTAGEFAVGLVFIALGIACRRLEGNRS